MKKKMMIGALGAALALGLAFGTAGASGAVGSPVSPAITPAPAATAEPEPDDGPETDSKPVAAAGVKADSMNGVKATVNTKANGTATLGTIAKTSKKSVTVASTVTVDGVEYKVTTIGANAFKNCAKATTVTLPPTVKTISRNAFKGAKKLKTVKMNITKSITVQKGAFNGLNTKKMTVRVSGKMPAKELKKFKAALKKAGFKGKVKKG